MSVPQEILERMREAFRGEAMELLNELDDALLSLEAEPENAELVHRVFRALHTIKGSGATAGFTRLAGFAHRCEEVFARARDGALEVSPDLVDVALRACDVLKGLLEQGDQQLPPTAEESRVLEGLARFSCGNAAPGLSPPPEEGSECEVTAGGQAAYEISFRPQPDLFQTGTDPLRLLAELRELGTAHIQASSARLPEPGSFDPESCYLEWTIRLVTGASEAEIRSVFLFVEDAAEIEVRRLQSQAAAVSLLAAPPESLELFLEEAHEHLRCLEEQILAAEGGADLQSVVPVLFRAVHSLKGNAAVLLGQAGGALPETHPLVLLHTVSHALESLLVGVRDGGAALDFELLLATSDLFGSLLRDLDSWQTSASADPVLLGRLGIEVRSAGGVRTEERETRTFVLAADQCLRVIGESLARLKGGAGDPDSAARAFERSLRTLERASAYHGREDVERAAAQQLTMLAAAVAGEGSGWDELSSAHAVLETLVDGIRSGNSSSAAASAAKTGHPAANEFRTKSGTGSLRVEHEKIDRLMRVVGELLVARGALPAVADSLLRDQSPAEGARRIKDAAANISRIAEELQASVMTIRMVPFRTVLQRFPRLVRDLSRTLGKQVQLVIEGDETEVDKTVAEQIGDPLVHLIRNALDHGIEPSDTRIAAGKNATGTLTIRTSQTAGHIHIEIGDDGRGIDVAALKRKAVERSLITEAAAGAMSDAAACELVFAPGLSTAASLSDVSGRGVGMDVVRSNIHHLRGSVAIDSRRGQGTRFTIVLPASLMVSRGILMSAGGEEYILPVENIVDMVKLPRGKVREYRGRRLAEIRGVVYPLTALAALLGRDEDPAGEELPVAVVSAGSQHFGLIVSRFISEVEILIKPLDGVLAGMREFSGAAVMGDGRLVLVLNAQALPAVWHASV